MLKINKKLLKPTKALLAVLLIAIGSGLGYTYAIKSVRPPATAHVSNAVSVKTTPSPSTVSTPTIMPSPPLVLGIQTSKTAMAGAVSPVPNKQAAPTAASNPTLPPLGIAEAEISTSSVQCTTSQINVTLDYINLTASSTIHPSTLVKAYVDYPNGASSSIQTLFFPASSPAASTPVSPDSRYISFDLTGGVVTPADVLFRVRVVSPMTYTSGWMGVPLNYYCPNLN